MRERLNLQTNVKVDFLVAADVNLDESNKASPIYIRMYELNSTTLFDDANFIDLYENDKAILADSLLSKEELKPLEPGKNRTEKYILNKETRYLAFVAEFFRYSDAKYKVVFPVTKNNVFRDSVKVTISKNSISVND